DRARVATTTGGVLQGPHLRAAGYEGHGLLDQPGAEPPAAELLPDEFPDWEARGADGLRTEQVDQGAGVSVGRGRSRFDHRRLSCVRTSAPERGRSRGQAALVTDIGAPHNDKPPHARANGRRRRGTRWP